ncbi:MAG: hypothetical protein Q9183_006096, partial [Haloplaca sp. 2 TL-2023]
QNGKFYMPVQSNGSARSPQQNDSMQLDDTKDKVYIHNLAAELLEIESDEDKPLFLPDIEKKLSKIPRSVLIGRNPPTMNTQMVLYNVPSSLSVPKEHDNVRRAIIDSRARSMEKQVHEQQAAQEKGVRDIQGGSKTAGVEIANGDITGTTAMEVDDNAMDIE